MSEMATIHCQPHGRATVGTVGAVSRQKLLNDMGLIKEGRKESNSSQQVDIAITYVTRAG